MKPEALEKYIATSRLNKTPDEEIKRQLLAGGWQEKQIDDALKTTAPNIQKREKKMEQVLVVPTPVFFPSFLTLFVIFLIIYNFVLYSGQIMGKSDAATVTNGELFGGIILTGITALILSGIYTGIVKLIRKIRNK